MSVHCVCECVCVGGGVGGGRVCSGWCKKSTCTVLYSGANVLFY